MEQHTEKRGKNLEWLLDQPVETQFELFRYHIELAKLLINQLLQDEVEQKAGEKYTRAKPFDGQFSRWGYNPGSVRIGEEKVKMEIPRLYDNKAEETVGLENYQKLKEIELPSEQLLKKIILGLSEHDYKTVTQQAIESFGLSQSSVSRAFMEQSSKILEDFEKRDLSHYDFVALVIDGKHLLKEQVVIALGVTNTGDKIPLGFIQTTTENSIAVKGLLQNLIARNFQFTEGLLAIIDGAKGLAKAIKETFGEYVVIQRCQWHKRENVVSYLKEEDEAHYRGKLQRAYLEPEYHAAKNKLLEIRDELKEINRSAAKSLEEGLEETLTIHKLGLIEELGKSLTTTNIIENLNSQLNKYVGRIKRWVNPEMQARWVATALVEVEQKMRRINNHKKLYLLRIALKSELKLDQEKVA
jgi:transposase-like protein